MRPLVSILIPAYNAEDWIGDTIRSAVGQTWERKEIIVVDDGSTDETVEVARRFESQSVRVVRQNNQGAAAARNTAFSLCHGDYIQWLDADDLLPPRKIELQLAALRESDSKRILLSSPMARFYYRTSNARIVHNSLCESHSPTEWLLRSMNENLFIQPGTWLTSRELAEAAGPWDTRLLTNDDGEYFCRVLLASEGTRFVPEVGVFYRMSPSTRLGLVGSSDRKKSALAIALKLYVQYLQSLEESERVRKCCLTFLQNWYDVFFPERPDLVAELQNIAAQLQGHLEEPRLRWKYAWMKPLFGWKVARQAQKALPQIKADVFRLYDKAMYRLEAKTVRADQAAERVESRHS
jgi:glycosyltransferase involved in cell wall biosynthesis